MSSLPESYNTFALPEVKFSHHPATSATVTPVVLVILNRPNEKNAFTSAMENSLVRAFDMLSADPRVRAVVLTGSDPANRTFCAGMDLAGASAKADTPVPDLPGTAEGANWANYRDGGGRVSLAIFNCRKPVVAALNGNAVGVGATMTLPADVRVASSAARIGFVFARRGIATEACSSFFLPRLIGTSRAMQLVTTGAVLPTTHESVRSLFAEIVEPGQVVARGVAIAEEVAKNCSGVSTSVMRDMIYRGGQTPEEAHALESKVLYDMFRGRDFVEGVVSFMEKREPKFEGNLEEDAPRVWPWWAWKEVKERSKI